MIETRARVIQTGDGVAIVEAEKQSGCGNCDPVKGCGKSSVSKLFCSGTQRFEVIDPIGTRVGDEVSIGVKDGAILRGAVAVYLVPLALMIAGAMLGASRGDGASVFGGAVGLLAGFAWARRYGASNRDNPRFRPFIVKRFY